MSSFYRNTINENNGCEEGDNEYSIIRSISANKGRIPVFNIE